MVVSVDESRHVLDAVLKQFRSATSAPEVYLRIQDKKAEKHKALVKNLFDHAKVWQSSHASSACPDELIIDDMDEEQIWQQLELQNEAVFPRCLRQTSKLLSANEDTFKLRLKGGELDGEENDSDNADIPSGEDDDEDLEEEEDTDSDFAAEDDDDEEGEDEEESDEDDSTPKKSKKPLRSSIVDDQFFKLSEMEEFLEAEDRKEMQKTSGKQRPKDDANEIDYFKSDDEDEDDDEDYDYKNFFGDERRPEHIHEDDSREVRRQKLDVKNKTKKKSKKEDLGLEDSDIDEEANGSDIEDAGDDDDEDEESHNGKVKFNLSKNTYRSDSEADHDDDDDDDDDLPSKSRPIEDEEEKSTFEHRQERLRLRIQDMEDQVMGEKSWQLRGEIDSGSRPQNSLLEEVLEFDSTVRPAPVITEETTLQLEDIIRQRIKDKAWNDVERKFKPANTPQEFRKKLVLDQEKSKESLAQVYEKEYLKEVEKLNPTVEEREAEEPKEHKEIRSLMKDLFSKLDALSNFSYTPKAAAPEVRIITNTPAINMEEVAPVAVSDAALLAPEEVRPRTKGDEIGKSERSETDKKRERRQKKVKQRQIQAVNERKEAEKAAKGIVSNDKATKKKLMEKVTKSRNVQKMKESSDKSIKSSKQFFTQLQDEVSTVKTAKSKGKRKTVDANQANAKKFKL